MASPQDGVNLRNAVETAMKRVGDNKYAFKDHGVIRAYQDVIRGLFTAEVIAEAKPSISNLQKFEDFERLTLCVIRCYEQMDLILDTLKNNHKQVEQNAYIKVTKSVLDRMSDSLNSKFYYKLDVFRLIDDIFHELDQVLSDQQGIKSELDATMQSNTQSNLLAEREKKSKNKKTIECGVSKLADLIKMPLSRLMAKSAGDGRDVFDCTSFEDAFRDNIRRALSFGALPQDKYIYFFVNDKKKKPYDFFKILYLEMQSDLSFVTTQICCFDSSTPQDERDRVFLTDYQIEQNPNGILKSTGAPKNNIEVICDDELEFYDMSSKLLVSIYYLIYKQFSLNGVKTDHYSKFDRLIPQVVLAAEQLYDFLAFVRSGYVGARSDPKVAQNHSNLSAVPLDRIPIMQNTPIRYSTHHSLLDIYGSSGSTYSTRLPIQQNYLSSGTGRGGLTEEQNKQVQIGSRLQQLLVSSNKELSSREEEARRLGLLTYVSPLVGNTGVGGLRDEQLERMRQEKTLREEGERLKREEREQRERERRDALDRESRERLEREKKEREGREKERREKEERDRVEREERDKKAREEREAADRELREKRDRERREREEREKLEREEREKKEKEDREKRERETKERLEKEDRERKEREARERLEREQREKDDRERREKLDQERREQDERDRAAKEILEANERALRAQKDKELRELRAKEDQERAERELKEANERALKQQQEDARLLQEKKDREDREAKLKAQREADELQEKIEREQQAEARRIQEAADLKRKQDQAEALRLQQQKEEQERLEFEESERKRKEQAKKDADEAERIRIEQEQESLRKRQAEEELEEVADNVKKVEAEDPIDDDFFDDFDIEDSSPGKKVVKTDKQIVKNNTIDFDEPFEKPKGDPKVEDSQKDEFLDDFDDLDDFTGSVGKKSAQPPAKKPEEKKPTPTKVENKKDDSEDFDDFDDFAQESVGKKDAGIAKQTSAAIKSEPPKAVQTVPKKRIAADDEFEFDDDDFENLLDDDSKKPDPKAQDPKKAPSAENPPTEPNKAEGSESANPAPITDKAEIKGGIMALKRLASNKSKEAPPVPPKVQNVENPRKDNRAIKVSDLPQITEFLSKTQPINEEEIQFVMSNSQLFSIEFIQGIFNEFISQQTVFMLQLEETDTIMGTALDHMDNEEDLLTATQDLGRQFNQLLTQATEEIPNSMENIKFFFAPMQLLEEFQEECLVLAIYDVAHKQVILVSIRPGMTEEFLRESELALTMANTFAQTINIALFGESMPKLTKQQLVVPIISDAFGAFLEESCEDPMLRYTILVYLMLMEPATDRLDTEGFKTTLEMMEEYSVDHALRFVLSVRSLDQANKLKPQIAEAPELLRPLLLSVHNLKAEKKASFTAKLADQLIPEDELAKFVAKDIQEMLDAKKEGYEKVFGLFEYYLNDETTFIYLLCLDEANPNLLVNFTTSKEPINSSLIDTIKTNLVKGGQKELQVFGEHLRTTTMRELLDSFFYAWIIHVFDFELSPLDAFRILGYNDACLVNELMAGLEMEEGEAEEGLDHEQGMIQGEDSLGREEGQGEQDEFANLDLEDDDFGAKKAPPDKPSKPAAKSKLNYDQDFDDFDDEDAGKDDPNFDDLNDLDF